MGPQKLTELTISSEKAIRTMKYDERPEVRTRIGKVLLDNKGNFNHIDARYIADNANGDGTPREIKAEQSNPYKGG